MDRRGLIVVALLCVAALATAPPSHADDYCVSPADTCAPANTFGGVQPALDAASNRPGDDRVLLGAATFTAPAPGFAYVGAQPGTVEIRGAGTRETFLRAGPAPSGPTLIAGHSGAGRSTVTALTINAPSGQYGLQLFAATDARDVAVQTQDGLPNAGGVALNDTARLVQSSVDVSGTPGVSGGLAPADNTAVLDSTVRALKGVLVNGGGQTTVSRTTVAASDRGIEVTDGRVFADNDVIDMRPAGDGTVALSAFGSSATGADIDAHHLTVIGTNPGVNGVSAFATTGTAKVTIMNSIVRVPGRSLIRQAGSAGGDPSATVDAASNDYRPDSVANFDSGNGATTDVNPRTDDPRFLGDPALGEFRLRFDSPLIDAGFPTISGIDTDRRGSPRLVDGDGNGNAAGDLGAFEYQRAAPVVVNAAATPVQAIVGAPVSWNATATDPDGDPVEVGWSWDDGASASGATAAHGFATAGAHSGTVTATDATGRTASAGVQVEVLAPAGPAPTPGPAPGTTVRPPVDSVAPLFSIFRRGLRLSRADQVAVRVECAAAEAAPCAGTISLASAARVGPRRRILRLGSARFRVAPGKTALVRVKLSRSAAKTSRRLRKVKVAVTGVATDAAGNKRTIRRTLTLIAPRRR